MTDTKELDEFVNRWKHNRDTPIIHFRAMNDMPGVSGAVYEYRCYFYAAKHKGRYKPKDRYYSSVNKIDDKHTQHNKFLNDTKEFIKRGRYSDYFFVDKLFINHYYANKYEKS